MAINNINPTGAISGTQEVSAESIINSKMDMMRQKFEVETMRQNIKAQKEQADSLINMMENRRGEIDQHM